MTCKPVKIIWLPFFYVISSPTSLLQSLCFSYTGLLTCLRSSCLWAFAPAFLLLGKVWFAILSSGCIMVLRTEFWSWSWLTLGMQGCRNWKDYPGVVGVSALLRHRAGSYTARTIPILTWRTQGQWADLACPSPACKLLPRCQSSLPHCE